MANAVTLIFYDSIKTIAEIIAGANVEIAKALEGI